MGESEHAGGGVVLPSMKIQETVQDDLISQWGKEKPELKAQLDTMQRDERRSRRENGKGASLQYEPVSRSERQATSDKMAVGLTWYEKIKEDLQRRFLACLKKANVDPKVAERVWIILTTSQLTREHNQAAFSYRAIGELLSRIGGKRYDIDSIRHLLFDLAGRAYLTAWIACLQDHEASESLPDECRQVALDRFNAALSRHRKARKRSWKQWDELLSSLGADGTNVS